MPSGSSFTEVMTLTPSCFHRSISSTVIGNRPVLSAKKKTVTGAMEACASKAGQESKLFACENPSEPLATITIGALIVSETIALSNVFSFEKSGLENPKPRGMEIFIFTFGSNFAKCVSSFFLLSTIMEEKKMLREIANDKITPKKTDRKVNNDLYENDGLDYDNDVFVPCDI